MTQHGVGLATPRHAVGEEQTVLPVEKIADQRKANLVEDSTLGGVFIKHIYEEMHQIKLNEISSRLTYI